MVVYGILFYKYTDADAYLSVGESAHFLIWNTMMGAIWIISNKSNS